MKQKIKTKKNVMVYLEKDLVKEVYRFLKMDGGKLSPLVGEILQGWVDLQKRVEKIKLNMKKQINEEAFEKLSNKKMEILQT